MPRRTHPPKRHRGRSGEYAHTNRADDLRPSSAYVVSSPARSPRAAAPRTTAPEAVTPAPAPRPTPAKVRTVRPVSALPVGALRAALAERLPEVTSDHVAYARTVEAVVLSELRTRTRSAPPSINFLRKVVERDRPRGGESANASAVVTATIRAHLAEHEAA